MTAELSRLHSEGQRLPFRQPDGSEVPPQWFVEQMAALSPLQGQGEDGEDSRRGSCAKTKRRLLRYTTLASVSH